ncbi:unnamed protein product, partial [Lymnaea stagnalis]
MVSLSYFSFEDPIAEQIHSGKENRNDFEGKTYYGLCAFRDLCGDYGDGTTAQVYPRNSKGRKDKRYQPFKSVFPMTKNTNGLEMTKIPRDVFFHSMNKKQQDRIPKKSKCDGSRFVVKTKEMKDFFKLTEDTVIQNFLQMDSCKRIADKYLIAMVFAYFKRADFSLKDYTRMNFFIALYLANDVEEDEEEIKYEIFPWVLGKNWRNKYSNFLKMRDYLLKKIDFKAIISRRCCDEIMAIEPNNTLWKRERQIHHGGAIRHYMKDPEDDGFPRGPNASPHYCAEC